MAKQWAREVVGRHMADIAERDPSVVAVSADLFRSCRMEEFFEKFPDRVYNVGIAEQSLVSFSAGLAHEGFTPFAFTMAAFLSMRACEQCRTDIAYAGLNARLVGSYAGVSGGLAGATHWAIEDCGIMRSIPGMTVLEPSDAAVAKGLLEATVGYKGPVYMRLSVAPSEDIYGGGGGLSYVENPLIIGRALTPREGDDGAIIASGVVVQYAVAAADEIFTETGKRVRVVDMHTLKPLDKDAVISAAKTGYLLAAQDHNIIGGLCSGVAEVLAENGLSPRYAAAGVDDRFVPMARPATLYAMFGLDTAGLKRKMYDLFGGTEYG